MQTLTIIIPVKPPSEGKSRLATHLNTEQRLLFNKRLIRHTFEQVSKLSDIARAHVVSRSVDIAADALSYGFTASADPLCGDLNDAVTSGKHHAQFNGAREIMVLPMDIAYLSTARLRTAISEFRAKYDVMIYTDRKCDGTNVLLWRPIASAQFKYGPQSAHHHAEIARKCGLRTLLTSDPELSFDVDTPRDLLEWSTSPADDRTFVERIAS
jgi:2-phospho-L-lactate guanylyltransferase